MEHYYVKNFSNRDTSVCIEDHNNINDVFSKNNQHIDSS